MLNMNLHYIIRIVNIIIPTVFKQESFLWLLFYEMYKTLPVILIYFTLRNIISKQLPAHALYNVSVFKMLI